MEKDIVGFLGKQQMKGASFTANRRFILKYDESSNMFSADDMLLPKTLPRTCEKFTSSQRDITCMGHDGNVIMAFNPYTKEFRWVIFGLDGDDTAVAHGTCEDF